METADFCPTLVDRIKTGSQEDKNLSFARLQFEINDHLRKFVNFHFFSQGEEFIEELLHQTWIKVWQNIGQCRGRSRQSILAWTKSISLNLGYNLVRDNKKFDELLHLDAERSGEESESHSWEETNFRIKENKRGVSTLHRPTEDQVLFRDLMQKWQDQLTDQELRVFTLCLDGYSKSEIATILGISRPRVSQYIEQICSKNVGVDW